MVSDGVYVSLQNAGTLPCNLNYYKRMSGNKEYEGIDGGLNEYADHKATKKVYEKDGNWESKEYMYHRGFCETSERWIRCCGISPDAPIVEQMVMKYMEKSVMIIEVTEFNRLRKGMRVRKYLDSNKTLYKEGIVVKGVYGDGFAYVQWEGENMLDMSVNLYDVVVLNGE